MYMEELPYIPEINSKYVESPPIYSKYVRNQPQTKYVGEPNDPRNVALTSNDNSYAKRCRNKSLAYHTVSKNFKLRGLFYLDAIRFEFEPKE